MTPDFYFILSGASGVVFLLIGWLYSEVKEMRQKVSAMTPKSEAREMIQIKTTNLQKDIDLIKNRLDRIEEKLDSVLEITLKKLK